VCGGGRRGPGLQVARGWRRRARTRDDVRDDHEARTQGARPVAIVCGGPPIQAGGRGSLAGTTRHQCAHENYATSTRGACFIVLVYEGVSMCGGRGRARGAARVRGREALGGIQASL
jgi:hypothetical protein